MATVHPSRRAFVPQSPPRSSGHSKSYGRTGGRDRDREGSTRDRDRDGDVPMRERDGKSSYSSRRRSATRSRSGSRSRSPNFRNGKGRGQSPSQSREGESSRFGTRKEGERRGRGSASRERDRGPSREREMRERDRSVSRDRQPGRERRHSPSYGDYRKASPPPRARDSGAPWRAPENMYSSRSRNANYGAGSSDFFESRRQQRETSTFSIWPPSPKEPTQERSKDNGSKRRRSQSLSDSSDSSEEERRRRRKEKKRKKEKREKEKAERRKKRRHESHHSDESGVYLAFEGGEDSRRRRIRDGLRERSDDSLRQPYKDTRHSKSYSHDSRSKTQSSRGHSSPRSDDDGWVEKPSAARSSDAHTHALPHRSSSAGGYDDSDDGEEVGPQPAPRANIQNKKNDEREYGGALLRGEGSAMAAFLQDDTEARIPRRGEIGLDSDRIAAFEAVGYVMSGSRHRRMNAVRIRKENQVISAEEKRGILKLQRDERTRREAILRDEFNELVQDKLKDTRNDLDKVAG